MKNIIIFHRGNDDSNKIASATPNKIKSEGLPKEIQVELINLDKRNIKKYFEKNKETLNDCRFYIYQDEENLIDYINDEISDLDYKTYTIDNLTKIDRGYHSYRNSYSHLAEELIDEYKEELGTIELWSIEDNMVNKVIIYKYDFEKDYKYRYSSKYFDNEHTAKDKLRKVLTEGIKACENNIIFYTEKIEQYNKILNELG